MNSLPVVLIYLFIAFADIISMLKKKEKRQVIVYIMVMIIPLTLSINIAVGTDIPSIASVTRKLFEAILSMIQEIG